MESEISSKFYICLDLVDGTVLYYNDSPHLKHWSPWRRQATSWGFPDPAADKLKDYKDSGEVPPNARIIRVRTTIEEVK